MALKSSSQRLAEAMEKTRRQWQLQVKAEGPPTPAPPAFCITVSREAGANGAPIARAVAEELGWPIYDRELLERVAEHMGLRASLLEEVDERRKGWLRERLETLASSAPITQGAYAKHLFETLLALAAHGHCVIVGRGANLVLPPAATLRVRITAPRKERVRVLREQLNVGADEATRHLDKLDAERAAFVKDLFGKDNADAHCYDLVLNSARFSVKDCARIIVDALARLQAQAAADVAAAAASR